MKRLSAILIIITLILPSVIARLEVKAVQANKYDYLSKMDREIVKAIHECNATKTLDAIIVAEERCLDKVKQLIHLNGGKVRNSLNTINSLAVTLPKEALVNIAASYDVKKIWPDQIINASCETDTWKIKTELLQKSITEDGRQHPSQDGTSLGLYELLKNGTQEVNLGKGARIIGIGIKDIAPQMFFSYEVGAEKMWTLGYTGKGTCVAVLDNGVTASHPMINAAIVGGHSEVPFEPEWDSYSAFHGTLTSSMVIGRPFVLITLNSSNLAMAFAKWFPEKIIPPGTYQWGTVPSQYIGIAFIGEAPEGELWVEKVISTFWGTGKLSWVLAGMQHVLDLRLNGEVHIDAISMSLGVGMPQSAVNDGTDPWSLMVNVLVTHGITVVTAAGNEGPGAFTITQPAAASKNIAVGGYVYARMFKTYLDSMNWGDSDLVHMGDDDEMIWSFSSRGPTRDYRTGICVVAPCAFTMGAYLDCELSWAFGTSFSAPRVAGEALLLIDYYKTKSGRYPDPETVKAAIIVGADHIPDYMRIEEGAGHWNSYKAAQVIFDKQMVGKSKNLLNSDSYHAERVENQVNFKNGVSENTATSLGIERYARFYFSLTDPDMYHVTITNLTETCNGMNKLWIYVYDPKGDLANLGLAWRENDTIKQFGATLRYDNPVAFTRGGLYRWNYYHTPNDPGIWEVVIENDPYSLETVGFTTKIEKSEVSISSSDGKINLRNNGVDIDFSKPAQSDCKYPSGLGAYEGYRSMLTGTIRQGEIYETMFTVQQGTTGLLVTLNWDDNYLTKYPADLDLYLISPSCEIWLLGASVNIPETINLVDAFSGLIAPGTWILLLYAVKITPTSGVENFRLTIEHRIGKDVSRANLSYEVAKIPYFEELPSETVVVLGGSMVYGTYNLPFEFPFYDGKTYKTICVSPNGYITFDQGFEQWVELESLFISTPMIAVMATAISTVAYVIPHGNYVTILWYGDLTLEGPSMPVGSICQSGSNRYLMLTQLYANGDIVMSYAEWLSECETPPLAGISRGDNSNYITINPDSKTAFHFRYSAMEHTQEPWNYAVTDEPFTWEPEGECVCIGYDSYVPYALPFSFPFYDAFYDTVYISSDGYITFDEGSVSSLPSDIRSMFNTKPMIVPMGRKLAATDPGPKIFVADHGDYVTIMWYGTPEYYASAIKEDYLMLVRLYSNGNIVMSYNSWVGGLAGVGKGDGVTCAKILPVDKTQFLFEYSKTSVDVTNVSYAVSNTTYFFENVSLPITFGDCEPAIYTLPFDFNFYGRSWNEIYVSPDGYVSFAETPMTWSWDYYHLQFLGYPTIAAMAQNLDTAVFAFDHGTYVNFMWFGRKGFYEVGFGAYPSPPEEKPSNLNSSLEELFPQSPLMIAQLHSDGEIMLSYMNWLGPSIVGPATVGVSAGDCVEFSRLAPRPYASGEPPISGQAFRFRPISIAPVVEFSDAQPWLPADSNVEISYTEKRAGNYIFVSKHDWVEKYNRDGETWNPPEDQLHYLGCLVYENAEAWH